HHFGSNQRTCAGTVFDNDGNTSGAADLLSHDARNDVAGAARRKWIDELDRPWLGRGAVSGQCKWDGGRQKEDGSTRGQMQKISMGKFHGGLFGMFTTKWIHTTFDLGMTRPYSSKIGWCGVLSSCCIARRLRDGNPST